MLSKRVLNVKPSATLAIDAKAKALKAQGIDVISFGTGEPDFDTPQHIKDAAKKAIDAGFTKYCPVSGTPDLKAAIIHRIKSESGVVYSENEIIVSCGAKHSLYNLFQAIFNPGDQIIIPTPCWVSYPDMAVLAGAKVKFVKTKEKHNFTMTAEQLAKAIGPKTKAVVINSPSNPTGGAYSAEDLKAIAAVCIEKKVLMVADEIYDKLVFDGFKFVSLPSVLPQAKEWTVLINGVSKSHAMTGWRIGYAAGPKEIINAMTTIQSQSTSNPTSISLKAAAEAYLGQQDSVEEMRVEFEKRRNYIVERLNKIKGVHCNMPQGAFYVFPNIKKLLGKTYRGVTVNTCIEFAAYLLEHAKIAVVPGDAFNAPGFMRLSYATSMGNIKNGLDRLEAALK